MNIKDTAIYQLMLFFIWSFLPMQALAASTPDIVLTKGEKVKIPYDNLKQIVVADEEMIDVTVNYSERIIEIRGKKAGETGISFIAPDGQRRQLLVRVNEKEKAAHKLRTKTSSDSEASLRKIESEIRNQSKSSLVTVEASDERIVLRGDVYDPASKADLEKVAASYGKPVVSLIKVARPMIEMDVKIVQVDTAEGDTYGSNLLKNLGLSSEGTLDSGVQPHLSLSAQVQASLNLLVNRGRAKILSEPHLSCRSGDHATFHSGGEIGFRVSGVGHSSVKFKEYGLILQIEPNMIDQNSIESHIGIEISAPTSSPASSQDVGFTKFNADSHIVSRPNQTIVIAGLAENIENRFQEHTPLLGQIPVLSLFFSETKNQHTRRDLLMLVTPVFPRMDRDEDYLPESRVQKDNLEQELNGGESNEDP